MIMKCTCTGSDTHFRPHDTKYIDAIEFQYNIKSTQKIGIESNSHTLIMYFMITFLSIGMSLGRYVSKPIMKVIQRGHVLHCTYIYTYIQTNTHTHTHTYQDNCKVRTIMFKRGCQFPGLGEQTSIHQTTKHHIKSFSLLQLHTYMYQDYYSSGYWMSL